MQLFFSGKGLGQWLTSDNDSSQAGSTQGKLPPLKGEQACRPLLASLCTPYLRLICIVAEVS